MIYNALLAGNARFGTDSADTFKGIFACKPDQIQRRVLLAPSWEHTLLDEFTTDVQELFRSPHISAWNLSFGGEDVTYVLTGIGAPKVVDTVLSLAQSPCEEIIFLGSVGALSPEIQVGDIMIPAYSICGDGACRYLTDGRIADNDCFGQRYYPDKPLTDRLCAHTSLLCAENAVPWHIGRTFSIDTIFAQFAHIDEITGMGVNCIEMETAALFRAAEIAGIRAGAIFSVSDNTLLKQSLYSGRSHEQKETRKKTRRAIVPRAALGAFGIAVPASPA